ncbi:MAG: cell wall hydrolase [Kiloniellaceae bacterium]
MTEILTRAQGGIGGRRAARAAIWAGLALYSIYLSAAALAGPPGLSGAGAALPGPLSVGYPATAYPVPGVYQLPGIGSAERGKARLFEKPTAADPREEVACLALNIYFEARGEPDEGKLAVGHVVMNRVASGRFPDTVCEVIRQGGEVRRYRCQFSWWCDGRSDKPRSATDWRLSNEVALAVYWGRSEDPTAGALWYHADYVKPAWRKDFVVGAKIGRHIFYRQPDKVTRLASRAVKN